MTTMMMALVVVAGGGVDDDSSGDLNLCYAQRSHEPSLVAAWCSYGCRFPSIT